MFDTGPLSHFARAGLLDALQLVVDELLKTDYRLPFAKGEFELWATENLPIAP